MTLSKMGKIKISPLILVLCYNCVKFCMSSAGFTSQNKILLHHFIGIIWIITPLIKINVSTGPWQRNFVDAHFLQFHMFSTVWNCTTIGLPEFYIWVRLKETYVWRKIQEAQSNYLLRTARLLLRLDTPLHGNNARSTKYAVYYASIVTHTVLENIKGVHSRCVRIKKAQSLPFASSDTQCTRALNTQLPCVCAERTIHQSSSSGWA